MARSPCGTRSPPSVASRSPRRRHEAGSQEAAESHPRDRANTPATSNATRYPRPNGWAPSRSQVPPEDNQHRQAQNAVQSLDSEIDKTIIAARGSRSPMMVKAQVSPALRAKTNPQVVQRSSWAHAENSGPWPQCGQRLLSPRRSAVAMNAGPKEFIPEATISDRGGAHEQDRNLALVPHGGDRAAVEQIAEEAVAVRGHGDQVALLLLGGLEDLGRRVAERQVDASPATPARRAPRPAARGSRGRPSSRRTRPA